MGAGPIGPGGSRLCPAEPQAPTYLDIPVKCEVALEGDLEFFLDAKGRDVTLDSLADSDGAVLGKGGGERGEQESWMQATSHALSRQMRASTGPR